jgi:RNA polymerase subunit RPABC4/transcription elongation factor Spt4
MICPKCKARFGSHYKQCPSCGNKEIHQEQRAHLHYPEPDLTSETEQVGVYVEFTELDDFGQN